MEYFDIVDEFGEPTGETVSRDEAHSTGKRHRTSHVWIVRETEDSTEILLQKRSDDKDSYPGCYDISSAGHIPAGYSFEESACRELKEELGLDVAKDELIYCGQCYDRRENLFHGASFIDDQVSNIYLLKWRADMVLTLQEEEVSDVLWLELNDCMNRVGDGSIRHCIRLNELEMVRCRLQSNHVAANLFPPSDLCSSCKGKCCKSLGCSLSPRDLLKKLGRTTLDAEVLKDVLVDNHYAIDRISDRDGYLYYLRMQHKCYNFIGVDAYGECYALGENGCTLSEDDRPEGGRSLEPVEGGCQQHYDRSKMYRDWRPYRRVLSEIWEKYEKQFEEDGTFDDCEENYMNYIRSKR